MDNRSVALSSSRDDPFVRFAESFREFETAGDAHCVLTGTGAGLREAVARRKRGDMAGALAAIRSAMERLAGASGEIGAAGGVIREIGRAFMESFNADRKGS